MLEKNIYQRIRERNAKETEVNQRKQRNETGFLSEAAKAGMVPSMPLGESNLIKKIREEGGFEIALAYQPRK